MSGLFITGVGTGVGKTLVTTILCHQLRAMGRRVNALKPVVSGFVEGDPESDPALILRSLGIAPTTEAIAAITPWRFAAPLSPHLAARREGRSVSREDVVRFCREQAGDVRVDPADRGRGGSDVADDFGCDLPRSDRGSRRSRGPRDRHLPGRAQSHAHGAGGIESEGRDGAGDRRLRVGRQRGARRDGRGLAGIRRRGRPDPSPAAARGRPASAMAQCAARLTRICEPDHA